MTGVNTPKAVQKHEKGRSGTSLSGLFHVSSIVLYKQEYTC
jgi:hypothetical protein